jgi:uncharacterized protein YndB with AHSA1/START domain
MNSIMHLLTVHASPERVYQALTTSEGISNWWTRDAVIDPKVGGAGEFGFYGHQFAIKVRVAELKSPTRVGWQLVSSTDGGFDGTNVEFNLRAQGDDTVVVFAHHGFKHYDDRYAGATTRWGFYIVSLKRYLESGKGNPNPEDIDF